jgi:TolB-like protein/Tfp pilus assembly protein PilF/predicted Ser/Thr protein kinase
MISFSQQPERELAMKCPRCRSDNPEGTRFCGHCAAPLNPAGQEVPSLTKTLEAPVHIIGPGTVVAGKYRIVDEVGAGGMGIVYKAEDIKLKRFVALKFLPPHLLDAPELKDRFLVEAQAAAALSHPNICVIHEVGESGEHPYIAMEYVEGETLKDRIRKGPLKSEEALAIVGQVAAGLAEAHQKGIIHRDIKSANIMVTAKGQAKVMDFGLAKFSGGSSLTKSQTTLGTVAYMSPEQARGEDMDGRTDIWSLGIVLFEMLTAKLPFRGDHDQAVIYSILHDEPESLKKNRPDTASGLDEIVGQALAKKPVDRYQTMEEFREDIEAVREGLKPLKVKRQSMRRVAGVNITYILPAALAILLILFGLDIGGLRHRFFGRSGRTETSIKLAVLPLRNLTGDPAQEYLSDGITEELISQLGRLNPQILGVIGRTSVMRYKKGETPIDQIGRDLGVNYILEGSMRREASRIHITAELIRVSDQTQTWTGSYEPELSGVMSAQSQVSQGVAKALAVRLLPAQEARLAVVRAINPEAYDAFLKGNSLWKTLKAADLDAALRSFELSLEKDPSYAPAYAGLAWVWMARQQMGFAPQSEAVPKAKEAALQAVALDDNSAEGHEALAGVLTWGEWDWAGADKEWQRALDLNPNGDNAHAYYAHYLANRGRAAEGLRHSDLAVKLDPFNALNHAMRGIVLIYLKRFDDAMAAARTAISIRSDLGVSFSVMQRCYIAKGMRDEQLADQRLRITRDPERLAAFERGLKDGGYEGAQRGIADVLAARFEKSEYNNATGVALRYLDAGDNDRTIAWLQKAYDNHDSDLPYVNAPPWDRLHDDPRYQALLRRVGIYLYDSK